MEKLLKQTTASEANKNKMYMKRLGGWCWYFTNETNLLDPHKCGKWMYFFKDQKIAMKMCEKAISENICDECKCTDLEFKGADSGVICFYLNGDDINSHRRVITFMLNNELIQRTKTGKLYNISFKFDDQTRSGDYGSNFTGTIRLDQFIDLKTGKWIR